MTGEIAEQRRTVRKNAGVGKQLEVGDEARQVNKDSKVGMIQCMKCVNWLRIDECDGLSGKSREDFEKMEFYCRDCMYETIVELRGVVKGLQGDVMALKVCMEDDMNSMNMKMKEMVINNDKDPEDGHGEWQRARGARRKEGWPLLGTKPVGPNRLQVLDPVTQAEAEQDNCKADTTMVTGEAGMKAAAAGTKPEEATSLPEVEASALNGVRMEGRGKPGEKMPVPIVVIGDSMVRNLERHVRMSGESRCVSMRGAQMKSVTEKAVEVSVGREEGLIVIQGGGNGLLERKCDETVKMIIETVQKIKEKNKKLRVAVVSIMPRPERAHQPQYETIRREVNTKIHEAVLGLDCAYVREVGNTGLSFLNMDPVLGPELFGGDGVHLNAQGDARMAQRMIRWIDASSKYLRMDRVKKSKGKNT